MNLPLWTSILKDYCKRNLQVCASQILAMLFFLFDLRGCPDQFARITTNLTAHWTPCKPSGHVRHRGDDRRAHESSNLEAVEKNKLLPSPGQDPQCISNAFLVHACDDQVKCYQSQLFTNNITLYKNLQSFVPNSCISPI